MDHVPDTLTDDPTDAPAIATAEPTGIPVEDPPRSRRALLAGALGGVAALVAGRLGSPDRASAAAGSPLIVGSQANNAGTADTQLIANSSVISLKVYQQGAGTALMGYVTKTSGDGRGVYGRTDSPNGDGVQARNAGAAGTGSAIRAFGGANPALVATSDTESVIEATNFSNAAPAISARSNGSSSIRGLSDGSSDSRIRDALGSSQAAAEFVGLTGIAAATIGTNYAAIRGIGGAAGYGVIGTSTDRFGVWGVSTNWPGVAGGSTSGSGVQGASSTGSGVHGASTSGTGIYGTSSGYIGVWGDSSAATSQPGVLGTSINGAGVYAASINSIPLYVEGAAVVTGNLSKGGGSFKIDHPLDPANKFLYHSFVESPDMMNVYNGNVTLDESGEATVELPDWWDALNRDPRYQLTPIGEFMPLFVKQTIRKNAFRIAGGVAGKDVSWQVTGIRKDAWAEANRIPVEQDKTGNERGKYLHPKEHGKTASKGIDHAMQAGLKRERAAAAKVDAADRARKPLG